MQHSKVRYLYLSYSHWGFLVAKVGEQASLKHDLSSLSQDELVHSSDKLSDVQVVGNYFHLCACEKLEQI